MKNKLQILGFTGFILFVSLIVSCSSDLETELEIEPEKEEIKDDNPTPPENPNTNQVCDIASDYPNLGPGSPQSCPDVSEPNNKGTLDCRTNEATGGYANSGESWGSYKITGGTVRYNGTKTRVERFFKTISQGINKKTILTGSLKIIDLSDGNTCIIQSHAGGNIIKGKEAGSTNRSAQFLVYAMKTTSNKIKLETHVTNNPYTTDTGTDGNGDRDRQEFKILNYNQEYDFIYETGYDADGVAFSKIKIGDTEKYITHNHTTERVYSRYGAYGTSDTGDLTAHVEFKDVNLCRE